MPFALSLALTLALAAAIGLLLGITGAGGALFAVPALMAGMDWSLTAATPTALAAVALTALANSIDGLRHNLVRWRAALLMAGSGAAIAPAGVALAHRLPERALLLAFGTTLVAVGIRTLRSAAGAGHRRPAAPRCRVDPLSGRLVWTRGTVLQLAGVGAAAGLLSGLLGVGGGFVIVPLLQSLTDIPERAIAATALAVVGLVAVAGLAASLAHGAPLPLAVALPFAATLTVAAFAGRRLGDVLSVAGQQRVFALAVLAVALAMLAQGAGLHVLR